MYDICVCHVVTDSMKLYYLLELSVIRKNVPNQLKQSCRHDYIPITSAYDYIYTLWPVVACVQLIKYNSKQNSIQ